MYLLELFFETEPIFQKLVLFKAKFFSKKVYLLNIDDFLVICPQKCKIPIPFMSPKSKTYNLLKRRQKYKHQIPNIVKCEIGLKKIKCHQANREFGNYAPDGDTISFTICSKNGLKTELKGNPGYTSASIQIKQFSPESYHSRNY